MSTPKQSPASYGQHSYNPDGVCQAKILADWPILPASILDQLQDAVITTDLQGNITFCNQATLQVYGYSPEELIGQNVAVLYPTQGLNRLHDIVTGEVIETGRYQGELRNRTKSGEDVYVYLSVTLLRDKDSKPVGMVRFSVDTTQRKLTESALDQSRQDVQRSPSGSETGAVRQREIEGKQFIIASPLMHKFMGLVDRVASHTETVLITGETGSGKELVARTIHDSSHRSSRPWVDINCAALPEHLVESELFGYEKGAFSGADASKPGLFELADKGTLFLDEIGELQSHIQVKLLRVLDGSPYYRLGGHRKIKVDVRVVAATNQDVEAAVREGRFRKDLFHRLSQFHLRVPPLSERPEDIAALGSYFLSVKAQGKSFSQEAVRALQSYSWPGNIRELRNVVTKVAITSSGPEIPATDVRAEISGEKKEEANRDIAVVPGNLEAMEEQMIVKALERSGGHRALAAEQLGISRRTLSRKLREYQIDAPARTRNGALGAISWEQQKFFRAKIEFPAALRNTKGDETTVKAVNLSTGGMGVEGLTDAKKFGGLLDVSFVVPETDVIVQAKARLVWTDAEGRAGIRFVVIEPEVLATLQHWANHKMEEEGWELSAETDGLKAVQDF